MLINRKHHKLVFSFFMSLLMSCVMSLVISIYNVGLVSNIINIWVSTFVFSFVVACPMILIVSPLVDKLVSLILKEDKSSTQYGARLSDSL